MDDDEEHTRTVLDCSGYKNDYSRMLKSSDCLSLRLPSRLRCIACGRLFAELEKHPTTAYHQRKEKKVKHRCEQPWAALQDLRKSKKQYVDSINQFLASKERCPNVAKKKNKIAETSVSEPDSRTTKKRKSKDNHFLFTNSSPLDMSSSSSSDGNDDDDCSASAPVCKKRKGEAKDPGEKKSPEIDLSSSSSEDSDDNEPAAFVTPQSSKTKQQHHSTGSTSSRMSMLQDMPVAQDSVLIDSPSKYANLRLDCCVFTDVNTNTTHKVPIAHISRSNELREKVLDDLHISNTHIAVSDKHDPLYRKIERLANATVPSHTKNSIKAKKIFEALGECYNGKLREIIEKEVTPNVKLSSPYQQPEEIARVIDTSVGSILTVGNVEWLRQGIEGGESRIPYGGGWICSKYYVKKAMEVIEEAADREIPYSVISPTEQIMDGVAFDYTKLLLFLLSLYKLEGVNDVELKYTLDKTSRSKPLARWLQRKLFFRSKRYKKLRYERPRRSKA